jgi:hypothetical protein
MNQQKWERDIVNRQRNIVFPDTVLNEGRFYRNIVYGKAIFSRGQKFSLLFIVVSYVAGCATLLAGAINEFLAQNNAGILAFDLWVCAYVFVNLLFWIFLAMKGLFPVERKRIVRGGYRLKRRD